MKYLCYCGENAILVIELDWKKEEPTWNKTIETGSTSRGFCKEHYNEAKQLIEKLESLGKRE